jgi:hypothetical protein
MEDFVSDESRPMRRAASTTVDGLLDEILPEGLEWERLVRTYPIPALLLAAAGGFFLGRRHGPAILTAVSAFITAEVTKNVSNVFGRSIP